MKQIRATERGTKFYQAYKELYKLRNVKRVGFILGNCYGEEEQKALQQKGGGFFNNRPQSDQEHCDGCKIIVMLLDMIYPEVMIPKPGETLSYGYDRFRLLLRGASEHELGENATGDVASDGTRDEKKKDEEELWYVILWLYLCFDKKTAKLGVRLFKEMQEKSTDIGKLLFLIDKIDAVLYNLLLEEEGHTGYITAKPYVTELDRKAIEATGDDRNAGVWLYNTLATTPQLLDFELTPIFLEIVQSAALEVRGEEMDWINEKFAA